MAKLSISDKMSVTGGKIMQEIPSKQMENRKARFEERIENIDEEIVVLEKEKADLQTDIADINSLLSQL